METTINLNFLDLATFYGVNDENLHCFIDTFPDVQIIARGNIIKITGSGNTFNNATKLIKHCIDYYKKYNSLSKDTIVNLISSNNLIETPNNKIIGYGTNGKPIIAKSLNQQRMIELFEQNALLFATGPAGSGKTYVAIALAVNALKNKQVKRIILSRPAVEAGEKIGFLPGDIKEKIDPFLQPLYDALRDMFEFDKLEDMLRRSAIQIVPLAFMRGRTLSDAIVILDEAQNATSAQLKMFFTRLGMNSKMIVTGDLTQIDLPHQQSSGLADAVQRLKNIKGVGHILFEQTDIIRHPLVKHIVDAYIKNK